MPYLYEKITNEQDIKRFCNYEIHIAQIHQSQNINKWYYTLIYEKLNHVVLKGFLFAFFKNSSQQNLICELITIITKIPKFGKLNSFHHLGSCDECYPLLFSVIKIDTIFYVGQ